MIFNDNPLFVKGVAELNEVLAGIRPAAIIGSHEDSAWPLVLKLGSSRSGSTVFSQWLASSGVFAYPSNFLALFHGAPVIGARVFELLTNPRLKYNAEFDDVRMTISFESISGKTRGLRAPHEFWQFWLHYFTFPEIPMACSEWLQCADFERFNADVKSITAEFQKPFVLKGHHLTPYLEHLAPHVDNAVYLHMYRNPVDVVSSVIKARVTRYGNINHFFGWRPREFELIKDCDVISQVAGQVYFNERAILSQRHALTDRYLAFSYEEFCRNPESVYRQIVALVNQHSTKPIADEYSGPPSFRPSGCDDPVERERIESALQRWSEQFGELNFAGIEPGANFIG